MNNNRILILSKRRNKMTTQERIDKVLKNGQPIYRNITIADEINNNYPKLPVNEQ